MPLDQIYTPDNLALNLVKSARIKNPKSIADFASGDGALLKAAFKKFPQARILGADIDPKSKSVIEGISSNSVFKECDFLNYDEARNTLRANKLFDLILLNPPFSNRGGQKFPAQFDGRIFNSSIALAFVLHALSFLSKRGELLAILPSSMLTNESDQSLREYLVKSYELEVLDFVERAFPGYDVKVCIVRVSRMSSKVIIKKSKSQETKKIDNQRIFSNAQIMRGSLSMHSTTIGNKRYGLPLMHTTSINDGVANPIYIQKTKGRSISGTTILLPRVGRPNLGKLALYSSDTETVISDCLFAIKAETKELTIELHRKLYDSWVQLEAQYQGSCARFITFSRIIAILANVGFYGSKVLHFKVNESESESNKLPQPLKKIPSDFEVAE